MQERRPMVSYQEWWDKYYWLENIPEQLGLNLRWFARKEHTTQENRLPACTNTFSYGSSCLILEKYVLTYLKEMYTSSISLLEHQL